jgi:hypothetical protein
MQTKYLSSLIVGLVLFAGSGLTGHTRSIESMPPVVVKAVPESGSKDVPAGDTEIRVIFSKEMHDKSWSLVGPVAGPDFGSAAQPRYDADHKTWILKVKLQPGTTYAYWLNHNKFQNFKDRQGNPAVPYLLSFKTASK